MGEPSPLRNPLGTRGSACVEVMTTLHGSAPSPWRCAEGCVPPKGEFIVTSLDSPSWIRVGGRLTRASDQLDQRSDQGDMDSQIVTVDQFAAAMASIQEALASLGKRIDGQQAQQVPIQEDIQFDTTVPPPPPHMPTPISEDPHARMDKLEQKLRQMRTSEGAITWEDFDGAPVASLPAKFRMPEIERYTGIGCPRIHLRLYSTVMRAHGLDDAQMVMLFPMSLSGAAQRWFASLEVSRRRTWDDLAQEFLRQFAFNTVIDVSRRELEALRQRPEESVISFISRWREKISQIIDRPSERDQISMIMRSLQPRFSRHLMGFPHTDFGSLVQALYGIEEGIARGLWSESSPTDSKGKRPSGGQRSGDVGAISSAGMRPSRHYQTVGQTPGYYYPPSPHAHYRPPAPSRPMTPTYLHPDSQPVFAAHVAERPPAPYTRPRAPHTTTYVQRPPRQFTQLGMPLSRAFQKLAEGGLLTPLASRPLPQPIPPRFRMDLHCSYHQGPGHDTNHCTALRHAIQDLIDQGLVNLGQPSVTTNPLPAHSTHAVHPSSGDIHHMDLIEDDNDDLPPDGLDHVRPLYITVGCSGRRVPSVLLDNGSALNVCPLATAIALGFAPSDFGPSTQTVRAYDSTKREVMGTLMIDLQIGPATFSTLFQVLRIPTSFNLLLGRPWIHVAGAIPSSLHQKVKFIHDGQVITVRSTRDIFAASEPVLQISHSEDDLFLTGFTFDEIQTLDIEDFHRDFVAMSFDQHSSTVVLDMMRGMTFLPGMGLGRRQQGPSEFITAIDHDTTFGLGFIPTEADYRHMARLRKERVRARLSHTPFDYPIRPYRMSLADYFVRGSETRPRLEEIDSVVHTDRETELQHLFHQLQLSDGAPRRFFPYDDYSHEITSDGVIVDPTEVIDGVVPHDEYRDEMDMMIVSQIASIVQLQPVSAFDMFGISTIEVFEGTQTLPVPELPEDDSSLFEGIVSPVEEASDLVDPPLSFDVLSGFVSRSDDVSVASFMDLSIF
uniref:Retrotransposon gag domain-containing protein n=1 Tax=Vitis vinifera TaxID=29760 RepID=A5BCB7_VITVI|nr:hypothetical protein VITISV_009720 [Vitis vinifera]